MCVTLWRVSDAEFHSQSLSAVTFLRFLSGFLFLFFYLSSEHWEPVPHQWQECGRRLGAKESWLSSRLCHQLTVPPWIPLLGALFVHLYKGGWGKMLFERLLVVQSLHNSPSEPTARCFLENIPKQNSLCFTEWEAPPHTGSSGGLSVCPSL